MPETNEEDKSKDSTPPIFKSWTGWYVLVLGNLVFLVIIFYLFTLAYK